MTQPLMKKVRIARRLICSHPTLWPSVLISISLLICDISSLCFAVFDTMVLLVNMLSASNIENIAEGHTSIETESATTKNNVSSSRNQWMVILNKTLTWFLILLVTGCEKGEVWSTSSEEVFARPVECQQPRIQRYQCSKRWIQF